MRMAPESRRWHYPMAASTSRSASRPHERGGGHRAGAFEQIVVSTAAAVAGPKHFVLAQMETIDSSAERPGNLCADGHRGGGVGRPSRAPCPQTVDQTLGAPAVVAPTRCRAGIAEIGSDGMPRHVLGDSSSPLEIAHETGAYLGPLRQCVVEGTSHEFQPTLPVRIADAQSEVAVEQRLVPAEVLGELRRAAEHLGQPDCDVIDVRGVEVGEHTASSSSLSTRS